MKKPNKDLQSSNKTKSSASSSDKIKTDMPLSEKDEVKNAEKRTKKGLKNHL